MHDICWPAYRYRWKRAGAHTEGGKCVVSQNAEGGVMIPTVYTITSIH